MRVFITSAKKCFTDFPRDVTNPGFWNVVSCPEREEGTAFQAFGTVRAERLALAAGWTKRAATADDVGRILDLGSIRKRVGKK